MIFFFSYFCWPYSSYLLPEVFQNKFQCYLDILVALNYEIGEIKLTNDVNISQHICLDLDHGRLKRL